MAEDPELLAVARIAKAFGVRGDVVVEVLASDPARFRRLKQVRLGPTPGKTRPVRVDPVSIDARGTRLRIEGVTDRTGAERLVGEYLFVDHAHRARLPRGAHYVHDIEGLTIIDQDGRARGTVKEVLKLPAHDVYVVVDGEREYLIPAVREFIRRIDPARGRIEVVMIEGMDE